MGTVGPPPAKWPAQAAYDTDSPTGILLDRIADKWTLMIHGTLEAGPMRFSDLRDALGGISPKVLTQALRALERDGLVSRRAYRQVPPKVAPRPSLRRATAGEARRRCAARPAPRSRRA